MARHGVKISATRMQRATENGDEVQAWGSSNRARREQGAMMSPTGALSPPSALQSSWKLALNLVCGAGVKEASCQVRTEAFSRLLKGNDAPRGRSALSYAVECLPVVKSIRHLWKIRQS